MNSDIVFITSLKLLIVVMLLLETIKRLLRDKRELERIYGLYNLIMDRQTDIAIP